MSADRWSVTITTGTSTPVERERLPELHVTEDGLRCIHLFSPGEWNGALVWVGKSTLKSDDPMFLATEADWVVCAPYEHDLYVMTHYNPDGPAWDTGFLECGRCFGTAHNPEDDPRFLNESRQLIRRRDERAAEVEEERIRRRRAYLEREFPRVEGGEPRP